MAVQIIHREELVKVTIVYSCDAESKEQAVEQLEAFDADGDHPSVSRLNFSKVDLVSKPAAVSKKRKWIVNGTPAHKLGSQA